MTASKTTVEILAEIIRHYVISDVIEDIRKALLEVPGNKSVRDTLSLLHAELGKKE